MKFIKQNLQSILSFTILSFLILINVGLISTASAISQSAAQTSVTSGSTNCATDTGKLCNPIAATSVDSLLSSLVSIVKFVAGIVLVVYFILAGFKYVTARGDETKIKAAHNRLTWTAVGGAILLGAEVIQKLITGTINQLGTGL